MKKLAVLGPKGTYSDIAAKKFADEYSLEIVYYSSILKTYLGLNECEYAILPFDNTLDGFVMESLDLIINGEAKIISEFSLDIDFSFVTNALNISDVKEIYAHKKASGQCLNFITDNYFNVIEANSNIESLNKLKMDSMKYGAIIPTHALENESFNITYKHIADSNNNKTRFVLVSKNKHEILDGKLFASLAIKAREDKAGILYEILGHFEKRGLNLSSIMSRPNKKEMGKYIFYFEISLNKDDIHLIKELKAELENKYDFSILGIYNNL